MDEIVNFVDDKVDDFIGKDTDIVKNIYKQVKKNLPDFTKTILGDDSLKIKKMPKRTTIKDLKDVILKSEEHIDIVDDIIEFKEYAKKVKKSMKLYDYESFFRKAEKRIPILEDVSKKMPSKSIFPYVLENAINDFFIYGAHPKGRPDLTLMYQLNKPFVVSKSSKEKHIIITYIDGENLRTIEYNYEKNTIKKIVKDNDKLRESLILISKEI